MTHVNKKKKDALVTIRKRNEKENDTNVSFLTKQIGKTPEG